MVIIHPSCYIDQPCEIGEGTRIWHFCHVMSHARIGQKCVLGQNVFVGKGAVLGDRVKVQNNVSIYSGVIIEDDVFLGPSMVFTNILTPRSFVDRRQKYKATLVKRGASVGANATILAGVTIGSFALVGAGAVVSRDVPDFAICQGVPARLRGWACRCGEKLSFIGSISSCQECGDIYTFTDEQVRLVVDDD